MITVTDAFEKIDRTNFVPEELKNQANFDIPLPIGFGQMISQPTTVAHMLEWLDVKTDDKVLDVGSGSGWTTALLSEIVGPMGRVYAVERVPELVELGRKNCEKLGLSNVRFYEAGDKYGLPEHAPYSKILVSAAAETLPIELLGQFEVGGKLVVPVQHDILEITKRSANDYTTQKHSGFNFVPLEKPRV